MKLFMLFIVNPLVPLKLWGFRGGLLLCVLRVLCGNLNCHEIIMANVYVGLGSNVGNRERHLFFAYDRIITIKGVNPIKLSRFYETAPVGGPPQPMFLNAVLSIKTAIPPFRLL